MFVFGFSLWFCLMVASCVFVCVVLLVWCLLAGCLNRFMPALIIVLGLWGGYYVWLGVAA